MRDWLLDALGMAMIWAVGIFVLYWAADIEASIIAFKAAASW